MVAINPPPRAPIGAEPQQRKKPRRFDAARREKMIQAVRAGMDRTTACDFANIHHDTMYETLRKGKENPSSADGKWRAKFLAAEAEWEAGISAVVVRGAVGVKANEETGQLEIPSDPRLALELLKSHPRTRKRWNPASKPMSLEVRGQLSVRHKVQHYLQSPDWIELRGKILRALEPFPDALDAVAQALALPHGEHKALALAAEAVVESTTTAITREGGHDADEDAEAGNADDPERPAP